LLWHIKAKKYFQLKCSLTPGPGALPQNPVGGTALIDLHYIPLVEAMYPPGALNKFEGGIPALYTPLPIPPESACAEFTANAKERKKENLYMHAFSGHDFKCYLPVIHSHSLADVE